MRRWFRKKKEVRRSDWSDVVDVVIRNHSHVFHLPGLREAAIAAANACSTTADACGAIEETFRKFEVTDCGCDPHDSWDARSVLRIA